LRPLSRARLRGGRSASITEGACVSVSLPTPSAEVDAFSSGIVSSF
jgi:hypothetical protein